MTAESGQLKRVRGLPDGKQKEHLGLEELYVKAYSSEQA